MTADTHDKNHRIHATLWVQIHRMPTTGYNGVQYCADADMHDANRGTHLPCGPRYTVYKPKDTHYIWCTNHGVQLTIYLKNLSVNDKYSL